MKKTLAFCFITLLVLSCAGENGRLKKPTVDFKRYWSKKKVYEEAEQHKSVKEFQKDKVFPLSSIFSSSGGVYLPSIIHPNDQSEMVLVIAEKYLVGGQGFRDLEPDQKDNLDPLKTFTAFYIDRNEVTIEQYKKFDPPYNEKPYLDNKECLACPAMGIDWEHAKGYCVWAGKRLPEEEEWEAAARGSSSGPWAWGDEFFPNNANLNGDDDGYARVAPVSSFPLGASSYGALDMIGNVWEWVDAPPGESRENANRHILKGGGWNSTLETATIYYRNLVDSKIKNPAFGFRCMKPFGDAESNLGLPSG